MKLHAIQKGITVTLLLCLAACGGGGGGGTGGTQLKGVFLDSPVAGINYRTESGSGKTNADGEFTYVAGETVTFSIGNVDLPSALASATVTPLTLANTTDTNHQVVSNILVLLQSIDTDGDPSNGIQIPTTAHTAAASPIDFNTTPAAFRTNSLVTTLIANSGSINTTPVSLATANSHFQTTLGTVNVAPIANAGQAQNVLTSSKVTLNGGNSSDANNDSLTYQWTLTSKPATSSASLAEATSSTPSFTPDVAGTYTASLTVSDGRLSSAASTVTITASTANVAPVANAGSAQNVVVGSVVTLNGASSSDANGDVLTYSWTISSKPTGSSATLSGASSVNPTFTADKAGNYVISLAVNDGTVSSNSSNVTITAATSNIAPTANAGSAQNVVVGSSTTLNGSASSDANDDPITYAWTFLSKPSGSNASLASATTVNPSFVPDVAGSYVVRLIVSDGSLSSAASTVTVTASAANIAPVANAGTTQNVVVGSTTTLNGSASSDANGDSITYAWTFVSKPSNSSAALSNATTVNPTFVPDVAGSYVFQLIVNDGKLSSAASSVTVTASAANIAPVANAGAAQNVVVGSTTTLNGSASSDANGDSIAYAWTFVSKPASSGAALSGATTVNPTFVPDVAGSYVIRLIVSDGSLSSAASTITVTASAANIAPVANAGTAQNVVDGTTGTLIGTASRDANGDSITYAWTFVSKPSSSSAALSGATTVNPTFVPDVAGSYVFQLIVNDGRLSSAAATVTVTASAANIAPVANAGVAQSVVTGSSVSLNGTASSDANGDALTYSWSYTSRPAGSTASLSSATSATPTFTADKAGSYVLSLTVNDGSLSSTPSTVTVTASTANLAPVANAGNSQNVYVGTTVSLNGASSYDPNGDSLLYAWAFVSKPAGSSATLSGTATSTPTFVPDVAGSYVVALAVSDGLLSSQISTVTVTAATVPVSSNVSLYLFGGANNSVYLGCLNCNQFDAESVCNSFGTYGSSFSTTSIWNSFGTYGSSFQSYSPWNSFSSYGPLIVGSNGLSYGYFTTNAFKANRTSIQAFLNVLNYYSTTNNLSATRTYACGN